MLARRARSPDSALGVLHGRLPVGEKDRAVWPRSSSGDMDVLVATTVIEVGVDVANATLMVRSTPSGSASRSCTSCAAASVAGSAPGLVPASEWSTRGEESRP